MSILDKFSKKKSGENAKNRLKLLLVSERADCSPEIKEKITWRICGAFILSYRERS